MIVEEIGNAQEDVIGYYVHGHVEPKEFMGALGERVTGPYDPKDIKQTHMTMTPTGDREEDMALHFGDSEVGEPVTVLMLSA